MSVIDFTKYKKEANKKYELMLNRFLDQPSIKNTDVIYEVEKYQHENMQMLIVTVENDPVLNGKAVYAFRTKDDSDAIVGFVWSYRKWLSDLYKKNIKTMEFSLNELNGLGDENE